MCPFGNCLITCCFLYAGECVLLRDAPATLKQKIGLVLFFFITGVIMASLKVAEMDPDSNDTLMIVANVGAIISVLAFTCEVCQANLISLGTSLLMR